MTTGSSGHPRMLDGYLDTLVQSLENRRHGLTDEDLDGGAEQLTQWADAVVTAERPRLECAVASQIHLDLTAREDLLATVDDLVRRVVVPGWSRLAGPFTRAERNGFFLVRPELHAAERVAWATVGIAVGIAVIRTPFIPLWADGWVPVFMVGGFLLPALRRYLALRRYESALNDIVGAADRELWRRDVEHATGQRAVPRLESGEATAARDHARVS